MLCAALLIVLKAFELFSHKPNALEKMCSAKSLVSVFVQCRKSMKFNVVSVLLPETKISYSLAVAARVVVCEVSDV